MSFASVGALGSCGTITGEVTFFRLAAYDCHLRHTLLTETDVPFSTVT